MPKTKSAALLSAVICCLRLQVDAFPLRVSKASSSMFTLQSSASPYHDDDDDDDSNRNRNSNSNNRNFHHLARLNRKRRRGRPKNNHYRRAPAADTSEERRQYLKRTSNHALSSTHGSLTKGKWHELVSIIKAWSKFAKIDSDAPLFMELLLKRLLDERRAGNKEAHATIEVYNLLLDAWACEAIFRSTNSTTATIPSQRAREILVLLQETYEETTTQQSTTEDNLPLQPNQESFSIVFHVVNKIEGPTIARRVLAWMEHLYQKGKNVHAQPKYKHYVMLLDAYANNREGVLAEGFIRHMRSLQIVQPDTYCFNLAIRAWLKAKKGRESAEHAQLLLEEMPEKDIVSYSSVIAAWGQSGMRSHAVDRAEELLQDIYDSFTLEPNTVVLNTVMSTWVKSRNPQAVQRTQELLQQMENSSSKYPPDLISYNTHIHALTLHVARHPEYAQRANDLLLQLERDYQQGKISFRPNLFTYNLVIDAWSRAAAAAAASPFSSSNDAAAWNAVRVLRSLISSDQTPDPDTFSFNQVFAALSKTKSRKPGAAVLAEKLLTYMEDAYKLKLHPNAKPDVIGYTSVIVTMGRSKEVDAPERAEQIVMRMKERSGAVGVATFVKPDRACYNALIDCWAKSGKGTLAARKAEALLKEMEEDPSLSPNIITYNAVLNSWAKSGTRCCGNQAEKYLDRMWKLYNEGDGAIAPNEFSYNTVRSSHWLEVGWLVWMSVHGWSFLCCSQTLYFFFTSR